MFIYNNKKLKNNQIQNIAITVELGQNFKNNNCKSNERYAVKQLSKNKIEIHLSIECPIYDLVYFQPEFEGKTDEGYYIKTEQDYKLLKNVFAKIKKCFKDKVVEVSVHSDYISDKCNEFPMSLEEFLNFYTLD